MRKKVFVAYYRVSTKKQNGEMSAQKTAVKNYLKNYWPPEKSFTEIESGGKNTRPELAKALDYCKQHKATLIVAKLDRLSRDLGFIARLQDDIDFVCCDMPQATRETIGFMAVMARWEREQIAKRTKEALAEKRKAGVLLGSNNPRVAKGLNQWRADRAKIRADKAKQKQADKAQKKQVISKPVKPSKRELDDKKVLPTIKAFRDQGFSYKKIAHALIKSGMPTRQGGKWTETAIIRIAKRNNI